MPWSERQRAMLRAMGLRVWVRERAEPATTQGDAPRTAAAASSRSGDAPAATAVRGHAGAGNASPPVATATRQVSASPVPASQPAPAARAGPVAADWLVIGDPLGPNDAADGDAGRPQQERLLVNLLRAVRLSLDAPTRSGRAVMVAAALPGSANGLAGEPGLAALLESVRPRLILALGRAAAVALIGGDEPLGRLRGRVHAFHGVPVIASFGLAYLLRHPDDKARAWADLCLAVRTLEADAAGTGDVSVA